jgi:hypothetical protein
VSLVSIAQDTRSNAGRGCTLGNWAKTLPPDEAAALKRLLTELKPSGKLRWSAREVAAEITNDPDYDVVLSLQMVNRHRLGACSCAH